MDHTAESSQVITANRRLERSTLPSWQSGPQDPTHPKQGSLLLKRRSPGRVIVPGDEIHPHQGIQSETRTAPDRPQRAVGLNIPKTRRSGPLDSIHPRRTIAPMIKQGAFQPNRKRLTLLSYAPEMLKWACSTNTPRRSMRTGPHNTPDPVNRAVYGNAPIPRYRTFRCYLSKTRKCICFAP